LKIFKNIVAYAPIFKMCQRNLKKLKNLGLMPQFSQYAQTNICKKFKKLGLMP
jgi:hypothetical protein